MTFLSPTHRVVLACRCVGTVCTAYGSLAFPSPDVHDLFNSADVNTSIVMIIAIQIYC